MSLVVIVESVGNKGDGFHTEGRIVVRRPSGKTFAFDTEDEAKRHFGADAWEGIKAGVLGHTVTFPGERR